MVGSQSMETLFADRVRRVPHPSSAHLVHCSTNERTNHYYLPSIGEHGFKFAKVDLPFGFPPQFIFCLTIFGLSYMLAAVFYAFIEYPFTCVGKLFNSMLKPSLPPPSSSSLSQSVTEPSPFFGHNEGTDLRTRLNGMTRDPSTTANITEFPMDKLSTISPKFE